MYKRYKIIGAIFILFMLASTPFFLRKENHAYPSNVILISIDCLRSDHLSCYGYKLNTTPNIDKFAKEATLFTKCITQGSATALALSSLHTSTYPRTHGVYNLSYKLNDKIPTLAKILKENNYATTAIINWGEHTIPIRGLDKGFDSSIVIGNKKIEEGARASDITKLAISYIEKNIYNKFFIWLHYFDPHAPYIPPEPYSGMFIDNSKKSLTDTEYAMSQYDGEIGFVDEYIGVLLKKINELNLDNNTIIIITADHGESFEHNYMGHGELYEQIINVPLIIKCKSVLPESKIVSQQVRSIDIAPTILTMLHIPKDKHMQGVNLLPLIFKNKNRSLEAFTENPRKYKNIIKELISKDGWKLIFEKNENGIENYKMYNINIDSGESTNLAGTEVEKFKFLKKRLNIWHKQTPESNLELNPLTEENKAVFKSLGYLQ